MLTLSPGIADVERGFSRSGRILGEDQVLMSECVLDKRLMVYDTLRLYGGKPERFVITKELLNLAHSARSRYQQYLHEKKKRRAIREGERSFEDDSKVEVAGGPRQKERNRRPGKRKEKLKASEQREKRTVADTLL